MDEKEDLTLRDQKEFALALIRQATEERDRYLALYNQEAEAGKQVCQERDRLKDHLVKYGEHKRYCAVFTPHTGIIPCTCGFEQALSAEGEKKEDVNLNDICNYHVDWKGINREKEGAE